MTEVGNPEIEALSSIQTNQANLLGIDLDKSDANSHHENLRLSDKPQIQQVNDDDLLSQISDICGEEFPEPKSATSYEKPDSLESISEESLPNSNVDSLLNDESSAISNSKDQASPIDEDEEMSLLVDDEDFSDKGIENDDESKLEEADEASKELESTKENNGMNEHILEDDLLANGEDSESKDVDVMAKDEDSLTNDSRKDEDSEMKDVDESHTKDFTGFESPKDEDSETKTAVEEDSNQNGLQEDDSTPVVEESNVVEESSVVQDANLVVEESSVVKETIPAVEDKFTPIGEESNLLAEESNDETLKSNTVEESKVEECNLETVDASNKIIEDDSILMEDEIDSVQKDKQTEDVNIEEKEAEAKRKRDETPEKLEEPKESGAKRLKATEEEVDSDDDIQFYPVTEDTTPAAVPTPTTQNDESDDEIIFYKVPKAVDAEEEDDDDIEIIEEAPAKSESKPEEKENKNETVETTKEPSTAIAVEEPVKETEQKETFVLEKKEASVPVEKPSEISSEPEKKDVSLSKADVEKEEDSDDDIMIVEDENPVVTLTEDEIIESGNEAEKEKVVASAVEKDAPETDKTSIVEEKSLVETVVGQDEKKDLQPEKKTGSDDVEIVKDDDSKSTEPTTSATEPVVEKPDKIVEAEKGKESPESSTKDDLLVDNSDNACDVSESKDTETVEIEDTASNCSNSSNLLKCGPKSAMDQEREEYGKAKRMRMSIDTEDIASNMSTDTDVSQAYSSHSLKRSHSQSPSNENDDSSSKKSKLLEKISEKLDLNKDIVKKIHKKLKKMTQKDLEHLVLQKIVESINYESKLSSLNEQLEKSHDKLEKFSQQYGNLKKQFNDLQLVHTRVTADLEKRNTNYVMPIKITRAVGLQVAIGTKASVEGRNTFVVSNTNSSTVVKTPAVPASPVQQPPSQPQTPTPIPTQTTSVSQTPSPGQTVRRGCVQKITPKRPVPVKSNTPNSQMSPATQPHQPHHQQQQQQQQQQPPKLLNRSAPLTPNLPKALGAIKAPISTPPTQPSLTIANLERNIQKLTANNPIVRHTNVPTSVMKKTAGGGPQTQKSMTPSEVRKNLPSAISIQPYSASGGESSAETKPQKGVIDLTDEDDVPQQSSFNGITTRQQVARPATQLVSRHQQNQQLQQQSQQHQQHVQQNNSYMKIAPKQPPSQHLVQQQRFKHPAPLPRVPEQKSLPHWKPIPPKPIIRINNSRAGIVISWAMEQSIDRFATITNYQIYAYQAPNDIAPSTEHWRYVDVVEAMLLPMAVTLTEFQEGLKYFFSVRAVDEYKRVGPFSLPRTWDVVKNN
ncbi:ATF7IP family protein [Megaselia abdita]